MVGANVFEVMSGVLGVSGLCAAVSMHATAQDSSDNGFNLMGAAWKRSPRRLVVKTESNVKREKKKLPDPPCIKCEGTGKVKCKRCCGRGRTNFTELVMLPKGEWPKWCWDCSGCGNSFCTRCFGTGEKRGTIGFHLPDEKPLKQIKQSSNGWTEVELWGKKKCFDLSYPKGKQQMESRT